MRAAGRIGRYWTGVKDYTDGQNGGEYGVGSWW